MTEGDFKSLVIDPLERQFSVHVTGHQPLGPDSDLGMEDVLMRYDKEHVFRMFQRDESGSRIRIRFLPYRRRMQVEDGKELIVGLFRVHF